MILKCLAILFISTVLFRLHDYYFNKCNTSHIEQLCSLVRKNHNESEFCQKICNAEKIDFLKCHSVNYGKSVHEVTINGENLVLKFSYNYKNQKIQSDTSAELDTFIYWNSSMWIVNYFGHCKGMYAVEPVHKTAGELFGNDESIIEFIPEPLSTITEILSNQLLKLSLVRHYASFAKRTEKLVRRLISRIMSFQNEPSFQERVRFTGSLFSMLENMHLSSNGRLLMCDVHLDNFGCTKSGEVKIIDADDIFFVDEVSAKLGSKNCHADSDCTVGDYNDCHSYCDHTTNICSPNVALSNVQTVCSILLSLVFGDISNDELNAFKIPYNAMASFSDSGALSFQDELSRIQTIINLLNDVKM